MNKDKRGIASNIARWSWIVFISFSLVVILIDFTVYNRLSGLRDRIETQIDKQEQAVEVEWNFQKVASNYRGYIAYGREEFHTEEENARKSFRSALPAWQTGYEGDTATSLQIARIADLAENYFSNIDKGIALKKEEQMDEINTLSQTITTPLLNQIGDEFDAIRTQQQQAIHALLKEERALSTMLIVIQVGILIGFLAIAFLLLRYIHRYVISPVLLIKKAIEEIGSGSYNVLASSNREDEIGQLTNGIVRMAVELERRDNDLNAQLRLVSEQHDELEAQNEEILAQQQEQEEILLKLTEKERQLSLINWYQQLLTGYGDMALFLQHTVPALVEVLKHDSSMVVLKNQREPGTYDILYTYGYSQSLPGERISELYGPAAKAITEKNHLRRARPLSGMERGVHAGYEFAYDDYYPLYSKEDDVTGFLLLTSYGSHTGTPHNQSVAEALVKQFSLAFFAQLAQEDRLQNAKLLAVLNDELQKEKLALQEQGELVDGILSSTQEGMIMCNGQGEVLFANRRFVELFGPVQMGTALDQDHAIADKIQHAIRGQASEFREQFSFASNSGAVRYYELYGCALNDQIHGSRYLLCFRDRTEEEKADLLKSEFVSIVSHELRTPLASVIGFIEILLHRKVTPEKQKVYMETVYKEANRLSNLINDFLDLQRIESGNLKLQLVPIDVDRFIEEVAATWQSKQSHEIRLELSERASFVKADQGQLTQVLHNLISNAIKYSPQATGIDVRVVTSGDIVRIEVQDYGLGIPEGAKDRLFDKFYRVDNTDRREIGGTGLGLAIVKEIVEAHGGRIEFTSRLGEGSTFAVTFEAYPIQSLSNRILILEDDENLHNMIAASLENDQHPSLHIETAEEAIISLAHTKGEAPLLCIVDLQLRGAKTGWDFVHSLLNHETYRTTPVIIASVLEQPADFIEKPNEKYLQKPFNVEKLLRLINNMLGEKVPGANWVLPYQDENKVKSILEDQGLQVKEWKVSEDFIACSIDPQDDE
ncbi:response regulator [Paenibacillus oenotherae]|uniref:histidine kinase n=1 Tax=Paenibacillus oenotherae TaxID=1435645 RepID=A0ABS7D9S0_9BACL|nr:ATP-binding protein [Paenibacillus oenotherae]MBW7476692.1 response regulator [Paenibacillus oenotherae]